MNVEAFSTQKGVEFASKFLLSHRTYMAVDESTTIKNPGAKRTKSIITLSRMAKYRRILTGSPVTKSPLDLYKQCEFLDPYLLYHSSYYTFRSRYATMRSANFNGRSVQIVVGYKNLAELSEKLKPFSYRVLKDDCLDLPPKTYMKSRTIRSDTHKRYWISVYAKMVIPLPPLNEQKRIVNPMVYKCSYVETESGRLLKYWQWSGIKGFFESNFKLLKITGCLKTSGHRWSLLV